MNRRFVGFIAGIAFASVVLAACSGSTESSSDQPEWLFTQRAQAATYASNPDGTGTLVLKGAGATTTAFTDRPVRQAHLLSTQAFALQWEDLFGDDPPNATLVEEGSTGNVDVLELMSVKLSGDGSDLVYTVRPIGEDGADSTPVPTSTDQPVALFIDPTLVELLVVISIAGVLVGLLVPAAQAARDAAEVAGVGGDSPIRVCLGAISQSEAVQRAEEVAERVSAKAGVTYLVKEIVEGDIGGTCDLSYE